MLLSLSCEEMQALAACNGLTPNVFLSSAGQRDAMMVAVHQLRSVCHDMQAMGLLCLLVYLAACLSTASEVTTLAEHNRELPCQPIPSYSRLLVRARLVKRIARPSYASLCTLMYLKKSLRSKASILMMLRIQVVVGAN